MANFLSGLSITDRNTDIPFFPNVTWILEEADLDAKNLPTFNWIQAFYDSSTLSGTPNLAVFTGAYHDDGVTPIVAYVPFAYSGERVNIKGNGIFSTGEDIRGVTITTTPLGADPATDILKVVAWGGMR